MKEELGNCYINTKKNILGFGVGKIKNLTGFNFNNETFLYLCNCVVGYINDCVYDSIDFNKSNWNENTKKYLKEDALDFWNDELNDVLDFDEKEAREFVHNFPKIVYNLIKYNIILFEK